ncbi:MAG TPA: PAS domain S-box protein [Ginsengibacter sp.]
MNNKNISHEKPVVANQQPANNCNDNYHTLFEQATDAIMVTDFNGNFIDVNSSLCTMFGYTKEELLQSNVTVLFDPENIRMQPLRFDLLAAGENVFNERKMIHKDGRVFFVESNAKKLIDNRVMAIARDVTERKKDREVLQKSEANLHTIFNTTDTIYVLMDEELRIISYNPRAVAFAKNELGHSIEISKYFLDYFPPEKQPALLSYMKEVLTGKHVNYEVSYSQPGNLFHWYQVKMFPISKDDNNVYGLMMAVTDITEKILLEQKLADERIKKQQEIADAIITAAENERHEIGRELHDNVNQLLACSRLYIKMSITTETKRKHPNIDEADNLIGQAIDEIRNLSHSLIVPFIEANKLSEAINYLTEKISAGSKISIEKEITVGDENTIPDKLKLTIYRIVQEQLYNIVKHAKASTIILKLVRHSEKILLTIKDDGKGFDTSIKTNGIGLINIKTRVSLFNGEVNINSSPGNGCELRVSFLQK